MNYQEQSDKINEIQKWMLKANRDNQDAFNVNILPFEKDYNKKRMAISEEYKSKLLAIGIKL